MIFFPDFFQASESNQTIPYYQQKPAKLTLVYHPTCLLWQLHIALGHNVNLSILMKTATADIIAQVT